MELWPPRPTMKSSPLSPLMTCRCRCRAGCRGELRTLQVLDRDIVSPAASPTLAPGDLQVGGNPGGGALVARPVVPSAAVEDIAAGVAVQGIIAIVADQVVVAAVAGGRRCRSARRWYWDVIVAEKRRSWEPCRFSIELKTSPAASPVLPRLQQVGHHHRRGGPWPAQWFRAPPSRHRRRRRRTTHHCRSCRPGGRCRCGRRSCRRRRVR